MFMLGFKIAINLYTEKYKPFHMKSNLNLRLVIETVKKMHMFKLGTYRKAMMQFQTITGNQRNKAEMRKFH